MASFFGPLKGSGLLLGAMAVGTVLGVLVISSIETKMKKEEEKPAPFKLEDFGWVEPELRRLAADSGSKTPILRTRGSGFFQSGNFEARWILLEDEANAVFLGAINFRVTGTAETGQRFTTPSPEQEAAHATIDANLEELAQLKSGRVTDLPPPPPMPSPTDSGDATSSPTAPWPGIEAELVSPVLIGYGNLGQEIAEGRNIFVEVRVYKVQGGFVGAARAAVSRDGTEFTVESVGTPLATREAAFIEARDFAGLIRDQEFPAAAGTEPDFSTDLTLVPQKTTFQPRQVLHGAVS